MLSGLEHSHYVTDKNTGHSYGPVYDELCAPIRRSAKAVLEIGVYNGDSLRMWRDYFPNAEVHGLDIMPQRMFTEERITTHLGSQDDPKVLRKVGRRGPFDLIVDDGSHRSEHQFTSLLYLWQFLRTGGVYVIEDIQEPGPLLQLLPGWCRDLRQVKGVYDDVLVILRKG